MFSFKMKNVCNHNDTHDEDQSDLSISSIQSRPVSTNILGKYRLVDTT